VAGNDERLAPGTGLALRPAQFLEGNACGILVTWMRYRKWHKSSSKFDAAGGKQMKIVGICCSGRPHGNTGLLLEVALNSAKEAGAETEFLALGGKDIKPCDGCEGCRKTGKCHVNDYIQEVYTKILESDGVIFGTPVYVYTVTAQAKMLMDRSFQFIGKPAFRRKVGGVIVTAGRVGLENAASLFNTFMASRKMINAGMVMGFVSTMSEDKVKRFAAKDKIREDKVAMKEAADLGKAMVRRIQEAQVLEKYLPGPQNRDQK
jgi:multimeric flavodoxin WrbA